MSTTPLEGRELREEGARRVPRLTGVSARYETPDGAELGLPTDRLCVDETVERLLERIKTAGSCALVPATRRMAGKPRVPDFFIIGAAKSGTTALRNYMASGRYMTLSPREQFRLMDSDLLGAVPPV